MAKAQRWDAERPWRVKTHLWWENGVPIIDLHDLGAGAARRVVQAVIEAGAGIEAGAATFVTGRGRHSVGPGVLRGAVGTELRRACESNPGWSWHPAGPGRWTLVTDPRRAPPAATGSLGWLFWLGVLIFIGIAIWACLGAGG